MYKIVEFRFVSSLGSDKPKFALWQIGQFVEGILMWILWNRPKAEVIEFTWKMDTHMRFLQGNWSLVPLDYSSKFYVIPLQYL